MQERTWPSPSATKSWSRAYASSVSGVLSPTTCSTPEVKLFRPGSPVRFRVLPSEFPQVLPQDVEPDAEDREYDDAPEVLLEEYEGAYYRQCDVDAHYEPGQTPPEAGLDEREHGDGEDERGEEVRSLVGDDEDERHEHQSDADRGPQLRHPPSVGLRLRDGARGVHYVGVRGRTLAIPQAFGVRLQGLGEDFVVGQLLAQRLD